ncbi:MAG: DUF460 domain-containing protein [Zestosphaera sp.]
MGSEKIVGVDIVRSGGDLSQFAYALVVVEGGSLKTVKEVSFGGLIRELWELRPSVLATDNVLELGGNRRNLVKLLRLLPPEINVVQVNVESGRALDLQTMAEEVGLAGSKGKLDPFKTALVIAYLAKEGYGTRVNVFENKVKIYVYPGRSGVAGGSRTEKFMRNLHGIVARHVKKVKEALEGAGIDYDLLVRRSRGGVERAVFVAYTSRERLYGVVRQARGKDVVVKIRPVLSKSFLSDLLRESRGDEEKRYLIVGYDPGMSVGLAVLDLDMTPIYITSGRELDRGEISSVLIKLGHPAVIATDKNPPPEMCRKLAASLGAMLYVPERSLNTAEKEVMVAEFTALHPSLSVRNAHERDALAAALKAYSEFQGKMEKLSRKLREMGLYEVDLQRYRAKVLLNETLSTIVEEIINEYVKGEGRKELPVPRQPTPPQISKVEEALREKVSELEREKELYRQRVLELEGVVRELTSRLEAVTSDISERVLRDRKVGELAQRVRSLESYVRVLEGENSSTKSRLVNYENAILKLYVGTHVLIPVYNHRCLKLVRSEEARTPVVFTYDVTEAVREVGKLVDSGSMAFVLPPKAVDLSRHLIEERLIPAVASEDVVEVNECLVAVDKNSVIRAAALAPQLAEERRKKLHGLTYEDLSNLLEDYRRDRSLKPAD